MMKCFQSKMKYDSEEVKQKCHRELFENQKHEEVDKKFCLHIIKSESLTISVCLDDQE